MNEYVGLYLLGGVAVLLLIFYIIKKLRPIKKLREFLNNDLNR